MAPVSSLAFCMFILARLHKLCSRYSLVQGDVTFGLLSFAFLFSFGGFSGMGLMWGCQLRA